MRIDPAPVVDADALEIVEKLRVLESHDREVQLCRGLPCCEVPLEVASQGAESVDQTADMPWRFGGGELEVAALPGASTPEKKSH